ncbi:MAG: hypothetical protein ACWIPH_09125 [Ostreibacterium sp.]
MRLNSIFASFLALALFTVTYAVNLQAPLYGAYALNSNMGVAFSAYVAGLMPTLLFLVGVSDRIGHQWPLFLP